MSTVSIVDSGVANLASIQSAFRALGIETEMVRKPSELEYAERIVLPGVGDFSTGIGRIRELGLESVLAKSMQQNVPLLAICLGMQILCDGSEEAPGVPGLGIISGICRRLPGHVRVPHLGWNRIEPDVGANFLKPGYVAFANSYALEQSPDGWIPSWTRYGRPFISGLEKGNVLACQFHPELSGTYGLDLLSRWLEGWNGNNSGGISDAAPRDLAVTAADSSIHRIIACLDVRDGRVVKGIQFQNLRDSGDPADLAAEYEAQGADEIVILDIAAAPRGQSTRIETVERVRERIHIPLTVGGGIRSIEDARRLLQAGADRISVNTAAVRTPSLITSLAGSFGSQCVTVAIDARRTRGVWETLVVGGRESVPLDAIRWAEQAENLGAGEILLTSWDRDGTRSGADTDLLRAASTAVNIPVIASGGIGSVEDARDAINSGASAVLAASIFHDGDRVVGDLKQYLNSCGISIRP